VIAHRGASEIDRVMEGALSDPAQLALEDIKRDLLAPTPMRRVLWGPARCRAADVALRAALHVLEGRAQVLVVCHEPQSALVMFTLWEPILRGLGHPCLLVSGELRRTDREALRKAELQVVFGTPAVFEAALEWRRLGIVIAFEQAGYGGLLAAATQLRPPKPDVLVVARTPVPFERLIDAWAGADLSWLEVDDAGVPGGTIWAEDQRERAWGKLGDAALEGRQVIIAFPLTRAGTDLLDMRESAALLATLKNEVFGDLPIALFHGALSADGRRQALEDFRRGKVRVLVATTTLEIAGPMPPDTVLMLEHADRMDIQRLLGWRALVGAPGHVHYVIGLEPRPWGARAVNMMADRAKDEIVAQACPECFPVEADPGELNAPLVWGAPDRDRGLVVAARRIARHLLAVDPGLRGPQHHALARVAHGWWARHHGDDNPMPSPKAGPPRKRRRRRKKKPT
jgi:ATP-dependent DNA helicase RecG